MRRRSRPSPALRLAVRAGAAGAVGAAVAVPLLRRRLRIPAPVTVAACAGGPAGARRAAARARSKRDVALFAMQMWAFIDGPRASLRRPGAAARRGCAPATRSSLDRVLGLGRLPNARLQRGLARLRRVGALNRFLTWAHWLWFFEPYLALACILVRHHERFPRAARQMAAVFDLGCAVYFAVPTAPPWWASEQGLTGEEVRRIMVEVGEETWGSAWPSDVRGARRQPLGGDALAALRHLADRRRSRSPRPGRVEGAVGWTYALTLGFALVYLGEHYVTDLLAGAGAGRRGAARRAARRAGSCTGSTGGLQRLERLASG